MRLTAEQEDALVEAWSANPFAEARCPACGAAVTGGAYPEEDYGIGRITVPERLECGQCGYAVDVKAVFEVAHVVRGEFEYGE